jgi:serine/threonine-protein kinase
LSEVCVRATVLGRATLKKVEGPPLELPKIGQTIDRYRVVGYLGQGGMAAVLAVRRSSIGGFEKLLAVKVMLPHLADDPNFVRRFLDEARIASRINHPNVVHVLDVGQEGRLPFIVMEMLFGRNLSGVLSRMRERDPGACIPTPIALQLLAQTAEGLHAAHEAHADDGAPLGLVHRDVSPQNIFLCGDGRVKVVDFGIAAARGNLSQTRSGELLGKLHYIAPEQVTRSYPVTRSADLWALGVVAWELLAGRRLFAAEGEATTLWNVLEAPIEDLALSAQGLPEEARAIVHRCLERTPSARPATAREVAEAFGRAAATLAGGTASDVAAYMAGLFGDEIDSAIRSGWHIEPPPNVAKVPGSSPRARRWMRPAAVALGVATLIGAAVAIAERGRGAPAAAATLTAKAPSAPPSAVPIAAPAATERTMEGALPAASFMPTSAAGRPSSEPTARPPGRAVKPHPPPRATPSPSATGPLMGNPF